MDRKKTEDTLLESLEGFPFETDPVRRDTESEESAPLTGGISTADREPTQREAVDQIVEAEHKFELIKDQTAPAHASTGTTEVARGYEVFHPRHRPPMAILSVVDDGGVTAERVRLRGDQFVVGRSDGDFVIPHDTGISSRHCEFIRIVEDGEYVWQMRDLNSTNGTFASISSFRLRHDQEVMIGIRRYRFDAGSPPVTANDASADQTAVQQREVTGQWQAISNSALNETKPALIEITQEENGRRFELEPQGTVIGSRSRDTNIVIHGDPFVEPRHCRIFKDKKRWRLENLSKTNGTWLRLESINIEAFGAFQIGEQRLTLRVR